MRKGKETLRSSRVAALYLWLGPKRKCQQLPPNSSMPLLFRMLWRRKKVLLVLQRFVEKSEPLKRRLEKEINRLSSGGEGKMNKTE